MRLILIALLLAGCTTAAAPAKKVIRIGWEDDSLRREVAQCAVGLHRAAPQAPAEAVMAACSCTVLKVASAVSEQRYARLKIEEPIGLDDAISQVMMVCLQEMAAEEADETPPVTM